MLACVKPEKEGWAKEMFAGTGINITTEGRKHLGAALGSRSYLEQYVGGKVEDWVGGVTRLAQFARSQPQATVSDKNRWDTLTKRCFFPSRAPLVPLKVVYRGSVTKSFFGKNIRDYTERKREDNQ